MPENRETSASAPDWSYFIVQHTPGAVIATDALGRVIEFNPAAERLIGYSREEALGRPALELLRCQEQVEPGCSLDKVLEGQIEATQELTMQTRFGGRVPVMISSFALLDDQGTPRGAALIIRDLTLVKRMEMERRNLVNMFAHDLKTPVVGVAGLIRRLLQGKVGPLSPPQKEYLTTIDHEMVQLEKLITRFLEFARLDLHIIAPEPQAVNVAAECQEIVKLLTPLAEAKGMRLKLELQTGLPELQADPLLLRRVLENLLENAIKYGFADTPVELSVRQEEADIFFVVRDQGPGIAQEDLSHMFEIFYRGRESIAAPGFGLGLATVKRIVDAHGGRIWVDTAPGHGTAFSFTLPLVFSQRAGD
jgi:two-component system, OmpR family, phosphate regulon sensor histidine kinase PhoR